MKAGHYVAHLESIYELLPKKLHSQSIHSSALLNQKQTGAIEKNSSSALIEKYIGYRTVFHCCNL